MVRCAAIAPAMPVPWEMRPFVVGGGIESGGDGAREVGMRRIDLGIDQCDEDLVAVGEAMRIDELELLRRVLSAVDGLLLLVLRQGEEVIGLSARDQPLRGANVANHICARRCRY